MLDASNGLHIAISVTDCPAAGVELLGQPPPPMGRVDVQLVAASCIDPAAEYSLTRKDKGVNAFMVDHGEFDILRKRRVID
ncbi:hypothetical protein [Rhizobium esperanzae]|uniref:Uncharacterized protein n=1 Tax=Rhizobium esperanzae TaxID=1967781 RepID=A0A7W6W7Q6_9HYPH|nr:hypothetical protein [Rhizobium esperanzae]MBB4238902.1 hypothetical protein [Rhizobium esperanzae]